jgi:hypothetical protein
MWTVVHMLICQVVVPLLHQCSNLRCLLVHQINVHGAIVTSSDASKGTCYKLAVSSREMHGCIVWERTSRVYIIFSIAACADDRCCKVGPPCQGVDMYEEYLHGFEWTVQLSVKQTGRWGSRSGLWCTLILYSKVTEIVDRICLYKLEKMCVPPMAE